jgi:hemerythrin-like domain-containing protein
MKATELLQSQHREIEQLFEQIRKRVGQVGDKTVREALATKVVVHTTIEEEIFYPALREAAPELIDEAVEEHGVADYELARLLATRSEDETAHAKALVLADILIRHIRKEETDLFRRAESVLGNERLQELGDRMQKRADEVRAAGYRKLLDRGLAANMPRISIRAAAKKTARRAAPKKKGVRAAATTKRTTRRPATRPVTKRGAAGARKGAKTSRTRKSAAGATRPRAGA